MSDLDIVKSGYWRLVLNKRRAKKLRKRGEYIRWSTELNGWIWEPYWHAPNPSTPDGLPWVSHQELIVT